MTTTIESLCDYVGNIDAIRNLQFTEAPTTKKLNDNLFERHTNFASGEVMTPYMKSWDRYYVGYKQHYYASDVVAFEFEDVDLKKGTSDYVAYWNFTGSSFATLSCDESTRNSLKPPHCHG